MRPLVALLLLAVPAVAAPVPKGVKAKPGSSPDGYWYLNEVIMDGKSDTTLKGWDRHGLFEGERYTNSRTRRPTGDNWINVTIRDPKRPALRMWGTFPAVIEVDGNTLRVALSLTEKNEITECKPAAGVAYYVYERVKDK